MAGKRRYEPLRQLSVLMALNTAAAVVEFVLFDARITRTALDSHHVSILVSGVFVYFQWTLWALRMLSRVFIIVLLSRLRELRESFGRARIWYLLRILYFVVTPLSLSVVNALHVVLDTSPLVFRVVIFLDLTLWALAEILLPPMGNRAILRSCAELLDTFGMEKQADVNRICGRRLLWYTSILLALAAVVAALSAAGWVADGKFLLTAKGLEGFFAALALLDRAAAALCVIVLAWVLALRFLAAFLVDRTFRAIEELTR